MNREYDSPEYKKFRQAVRKRDKNKCKMCGSRKKLNVHHIVKWSDAPLLRFDVSNGITLCSDCHKSIRGHEGIWAPYFTKLIQ